MKQNILTTLIAGIIVLILLVAGSGFETDTKIAGSDFGGYIYQNNWIKYENVIEQNTEFDVWPPYLDFLPIYLTVDGKYHDKTKIGEGVGYTNNTGHDVRVCASLFNWGCKVK